jgi:hypothetical protein
VCMVSAISGIILYRICFNGSELHKQDYHKFQNVSKREMWSETN